MLVSFQIQISEHFACYRNVPWNESLNTPSSYMLSLFGYFAQDCPWKADICGIRK